MKATTGLNQFSRRFGVLHRTLYYKPTRSAPKVNPMLTKKVSRDNPSAFVRRTIGFLLGLNQNTAQGINQIKGWQCCKRLIGFQPRAQAMPSVTQRPNERYAADLT